MKLKQTILFLIIGLYSCSTYKGVTLSTFHYNNKLANSKIVDRYPEYGDGKRDGCVVLDEISLEVKIDKIGDIKGKVSDADSKKPLNNALVLIKTLENSRIEAITDSMGVFNSSISGQLTGLQIEHIGYRGLIIKF